ILKIRKRKKIKTHVDGEMLSVATEASLPFASFSRTSEAQVLASTTCGVDYLMKSTLAAVRERLQLEARSFWLPEIHYQQFRFSHFFDGEAQSFATVPGIFYDAVGHVIDAEGGYVPGDHASDFEFFVRLEKQLRVAGKDSGLHSISRVVDLAESLI